MSKTAARRRKAITVVQCACGASHSYEHWDSGNLPAAGRKLINLFRHFHEPHGIVTEAIYSP